MEIFIDTADVSEIKKYYDLGIIDGVTTNPTLIARTGKNFKQVINGIAEVVVGPLSLEAVSAGSKEMIEEARELSKISPNVVVKIPMTSEGLKTVKVLNKEGIQTNVTLVFSTNQALLAAKAGATYISPFIGRLDDRGHEGMEIVRDISLIFRNYGITTKIIVASIRHPRHVIEAAKVGAHVATIPPNVLEKMLSHPLTTEGLQRFEQDWKKVQKKS